MGKRLRVQALRWLVGPVRRYVAHKHVIVFLALIFVNPSENLAAGTGDYTIAAAIKSWTDEVCACVPRPMVWPHLTECAVAQYNPNNPQPSHFTQVVWKSTKTVGCAVQTCNGIFDPKYGPAKYYVCEYSPAGNVIGQFP